MTGSDSPSGSAPEPAALGGTDDLFAVLYQELHGLARRHLLNQGMGFSLGTTTLLHEAYLNLSGRKDVRFSDRARFLGYASRAMRGLIIDYARSRSAAKRGGEFVLLPLGGDRDAPAGATDLEQMEELSEALDRLAELDPALAELVDLHFFCGLSFVEIAALRGVADRTVQRDWRKARMILHRTLRPAAPGQGAGDPMSGS
jgi:RNA polymerase sigma factor (TIGR02999 family)